MRTVATILGGLSSTRALGMLEAIFSGRNRDDLWSGAHSEVKDSFCGFLRQVGSNLEELIFVCGEDGLDPVLPGWLCLVWRGQVVVLAPPVLGGLADGFAPVAVDPQHGGGHLV